MNLTAQLSLNKKVSQQEKLIFTKHLAVMIKSGIPIAEALDTLWAQAKNPYFKLVLKSILSDIENGKSLAVALQKYPKVFDHFFISLIEISEESGTLEENLEFLSGQLSKDYSLRKKIKSAMLYPGIVLLTALIMGTFISIYVLPKLVDFFESFDTEMPLSTKILIFISKTMRDYGLFIVPSLVILIVLFILMINTNVVKPYWHKFILKVPLLGLLIQYGQLSRFSRNLGTLIKSGVPVVKSLEVTAQTLSNLKYRSDLLEISKLLTKGKNIGESMGKSDYWEYPPVVSRMIAVGEKSGKLDETLLYLGDFFDDEVDDISRNLSTILEPILLIGIGLVVGFIALSIISPIYQLTGSIGK